MDEAQGDEFREPMGLFLDIANQAEMIYHMRRAFHMSVHDSRGGWHPQTVRGGDNLDPRRDVNLLVAQNLAHAVVENLGRGAGIEPKPWSRSIPIYSG